MSSTKKVLLTPLAVSDDHGHFVCIAIRDPETQEIIDTAVTSQQLADKAGIPIERSRQIFQTAWRVADLRLVDL